MKYTPITEEEREVVRGICEYQDLTALNEVKEVIQSVTNSTGMDFYIECCGVEIRVISDAKIWDIYVESIEDLIKECYLGGCEDVPHFIAIDWEETACNCYVDGYGHHFNGWDGSEHETTNFYYFRVN